MAIFTDSSFDLRSFEECLKYVQDSVHWLITNDHFLSVQSTVPGETLSKTTNTLQSIILMIKRLQNSTRPVNRLPPEILSEVFLFVQGDAPRISSKSELPPRSDPSYHQFDLVCRQWQQVIHNNPTFWTRIDLAFSTRPERVALLLSRSCAMPLTVYADCHTFLLRSKRPQAHRHVLSLASRSKELRVINASVKFLAAFLPQAPQLEVLTIKKSWSNSDNKRLACDFSRLKVLSVTGTTLWQSWSTGNLRYVYLGVAEWNKASLIGMLNLLRKNPRLEELIIWNISVRDEDRWDDIQIEVEEHLPLSLPHIKRLLVQDPHYGSLRSPMSDILSRIKVSQGCARQFCLAAGNAYLVFKPRNQESSHFPVTRLFIDEGGVVGTDDVTSWAIRQGQYDTFLEEHIDDTGIRELWLSEHVAFHQDVFLFCDSPSEPPLAMPNLTKVVIMQMVTDWLIELSSFDFGCFMELQLHTQSYVDEDMIIRFISTKKNDGHMIKTLRFVRESSPRYSSESFFGWRSDLSGFAEHVGEVIFEERPCDGTDADRFGFKLPDVCNTPSPVHSEWQPWSTFIR